jgi:hypothetical protein
MSAHRFRLAVIHRRIEAEIDREMSRCHPNDWRLVRLKKLKLALKEQL